MSDNMGPYRTPSPPVIEREPMSIGKLLQQYPIVAHLIGGLIIISAFVGMTWVGHLGLLFPKPPHEANIGLYVLMCVLGGFVNIAIFLIVLCMIAFCIHLIVCGSVVIGKKIIEILNND